LNQRENAAVAFEKGFRAAMYGWGPDGAEAAARAISSRRDLKALIRAYEKGFDTGVRWLAVMGGHQQAMATLARSGVMSEAAYQAWVRVKDHVAKEPCIDCQWISGCAKTGWACQKFRVWCGEHISGTRPMDVPDGPYLSEVAA
jgi:hypothetical protein